MPLTDAVHIAVNYISRSFDHLVRQSTTDRRGAPFLKDQQSIFFSRNVFGLIFHLALHTNAQHNSSAFLSSGDLQVNSLVAKGH